jgi:K+-transporting ATPase A subunit
LDDLSGKERRLDAFESNDWSVMAMNPTKGQAVEGLLSKLSALGVVSVIAFLSLKHSTKSTDSYDYSKLIAI